ncbi:uncharacterized protein SETTUDRAFT_159944 [Exserohilum turcica Et28A]|uniref:Major facilitator superfamily (MFS) profile domain-containing protein n=1 Tax=Exserohilum turcicum (strain 28A) TaxID=671987 RepID=R0KHQ2_EXST2|nr:uncharacterized protein SETTUDRAFT_159944 [Exserohilum turcica Et28A]EOA88754.1 hypothetical protein SETTUDRAFT_159944 [Exserohilum turcica Et28A]
MDSDEKSSAQSATSEEPPEEPYTVFSKGMRIWIVALVSVSALISPFGVAMFLPALNTLSDVLHITPVQVNLSVTTFMIAQGIAPTIFGTLSDNSGRRLTFIICFVIFCVANVGLALQTSYVALLLLRMLQAVGGTAAIALSMAVVADISTSANRGTYMGYAQAGILVGPAFGPTIGGLLDRYLGWRAIFWFQCIFSGVLLIIFIFFFPETCRKVVGNGSIPARGVNRSVISCIQDRKQRKANPGKHIARPPRQRIAWPNPLATLSIFAEKESGLLLLYNGFFFTGMMVSVAAIPDLFHNVYGLDSLDIGLCYISNGVASFLASMTMGRLADWNFRRHAHKLGIPIVRGKQQDLSNFPIERVRLEILIPSHIIGVVGLIIFGWTLYFRTHIAGPEVALFIMGFGITGAFNVTNGLLVELHRDKPATATAAVNFARCLMSAGGAAAILPMCRAMNTGWAFTFIALVYILLLGLVLWIMRHGMTWRQELAEKQKQKMKLKKEKEDKEARERDTV